MRLDKSKIKPEYTLTGDDAVGYQILNQITDAFCSRDDWGVFMAVRDVFTTNIHFELRREQVVKETRHTPYTATQIYQALTALSRNGYLYSTADTWGNTPTRAYGLKLSALEE